MSKIVKLLCVLLSAALIFSTAFVANAKTASQLRNEREKIQAEINSAQQKINNLKEKKDKQQEYINALRSKITLLEDKLDNLESQRNALQKEIDEVSAKIKKTEAEIQETQRQIEAKQEEFREIYELYCQRLRAMYMSGNVTTLEIILESGWDMGSLLTRAQMIKSVSEKDNETLSELNERMQEITQQRQLLADKKAELDADKATLDAQKAELQSSIDEISASKKELDAEAAECNAAIRKLNSQTAEMQELIETDRDRLKQIEKEIQQAATRKPPSNYTPGTGSLGYPTSYRNISAGYPNYSSGAYHGGIDFPCPKGTPVYAADSGYVSLAKELTYSYGKYIMINHGNGISTLYAHNSQLCVKEGQAVNKGDLIAYSGSTGNSSGPHCHFEVRVNGTRVNPKSYLG